MAINQSRNIRVGLQGLPPPSQAEVDVLMWLETNALCGPSDEALYLRSPGLASQSPGKKRRWAERRASAWEWRPELW